MDRFRYTRGQRIRSSREFSQIYDQKLRAGDAHLLMFVAFNGQQVSRLGMSISKKNGNSPQRHRIRRLIREAFRLEQFRIPAGLDLICIPRAGSGSTLDDYRCSIVALSRKISKRMSNDV